MANTSEFGSKNSLQQFKKFNRQRRVLYSEESFASGIKFATSPLAQGLVRNLVNFDLKDDGESLTPRQGLRTYEISQEVLPTEVYDDTQEYQEKQIYHASENIEEDGNKYRRALIGNVNVTQQNQDKAVKTGSLDLLTIYPQGLGGNVENYTETDAIEVLAQHTESDSNYEYFFNSPSKAQIHGIELEDPSVLATHIGTELAAEGTKHYYCFRRNKTTNEVKPVFITFDETLGYYVFEELTPQETTAYNATLSMYNMLQEDPYTFTDKDNAASLQFMGAYVVGPDGKAVQATYINTEYTFRVNYAVNRGGKYKLVWEWKEPVASNWTELKTEYIEFPTTGELPKLQITWVAPVTAVILRLQCFPIDTSRQQVTLKTFSTTAPSGSEGDHYFNPDERKIYEYTQGAWVNPVFPLTSVLYKREDENNQLYRWAGNVMVTTDEYDYVASNMTFQNLTFAQINRDTTQKVKYMKYDLSTCRGMCTWQHRICAYAPDKGLNMLFLSEPNNPAWFPFPRNVSLFNENIIHCIPYLDYLLVFTSEALYQITLSQDGDTWTETCLQRNLNINMWDIPLIKIIKNMVFFKSNNYFYMVVPSATSTSGLTVAPISGNIEQFLDNFEEAVDETLKEVYDNKTPYKLIKYKNHVNYKNIYNVYTFESDRDLYINLFLIYNIETRYWTIYCIESKSMLDSYLIDIADVNIYMSYTPVVINNNISHSIQFLKYSNSNNHDFYIHPFLTPSDDVEGICEEKQFIKNYQYLDTGYREHESDFKKRYRELQFKLNNFAQVDLTFYTQFWVDGYIRQDESSYKINQVVDPTDPRFGVITYDRTFEYQLKTPYPYIYDEDYDVENKVLRRTAGHQAPGATILGTAPLLEDDQGRLYRHNPDEKTIDKLMWKLDVSEFPETVYWKIRFPISGKGYVPRLKLLNTDQENYEILNINWVFRSLYAR
jgi:hypothetical protein